jgi:hypothetical protein
VSGSDGSLTDFINTQGDGDGQVPLVNTANPVELGKLGGTVISGFVAQVVLGLLQVVNAWKAFIVTPITGATEFLAGTDRASLKFGEVGQTGLINALFDPFTNAIATAWAGVGLEKFGLGAVLVAFALVLGSLWILLQAVSWIRSEGVV